MQKNKKEACLLLLFLSSICVNAQMYGVSENSFGDLVLSQIDDAGVGRPIRSLVTGPGYDVPYIWGISAYNSLYNKYFVFAASDEGLGKFVLFEILLQNDNPIKSTSYWNQLPSSLEVDEDANKVYGILQGDSGLSVVEFDTKNKKLVTAYGNMPYPERNLISVGVSAFDQTRKIYYYLAADNTTTYLMGVDIPNIVIRHQFPVPNNFYSIQIDQDTGVLYGLQNVAGQPRLIIIDVHTGLTRPVNVTLDQTGVTTYFTASVVQSKYTYYKRFNATANSYQLVRASLGPQVGNRSKIATNNITTLYTDFMSDAAPSLFDKESSKSINVGVVIVLPIVLGVAFIAAVTGVIVFFVIRRRRNGPSEPKPPKEPKPKKEKPPKEPKPKKEKPPKIPPRDSYEKKATTTDYKSVVDVELNPMGVPPKPGQDSHYKKLPERGSALFPPRGNRSDNASRTELIVKYSDLTLDKEIGKGAYGIVYMGKWRNSKVAIKMLRTDSGLMDDNAMRAFQEEAALMMKLRPHMNVVLLLGITFTPDPLCIITEYVENGSLYDYLASNAIIPMTMKVKFMKGIASGVLHLHQEGIVHRDLAARNVLLTAGMEPKITDFGMSRVSTSDNNSTKSETGPLKWMAPESINERVYSWATDSWSYGVTCWEILERKIPYEDLDPVQAASRVCFQGLRLIVPANTPMEIAEIIAQCFEVEPVRRPNFKDICDRLESVQVY